MAYLIYYWAVCLFIHVWFWQFQFSVQQYHSYKYWNTTWQISVTVRCKSGSKHVMWTWYYSCSNVNVRTYGRISGLQEHFLLPHPGDWPVLLCFTCRGGALFLTDGVVTSFPLSRHRVLVKRMVITQFIKFPGAPGYKRTTTLSLSASSCISSSSWHPACIIVFNTSRAHNSQILRRSHILFFHLHFNFK